MRDVREGPRPRSTLAVDEKYVLAMQLVRGELRSGEGGDLEVRDGDGNVKAPSQLGALLQRNAPVLQGMFAHASLQGGSGGGSGGAAAHSDVRGKTISANQLR